MIRASILISLGLISMSLILSSSSAHADRRSFVWNYEARTMPKGEAEIEYYLTSKVERENGAVDDTVNFQHQVELEYGITDNFDVGIYQVFEQEEGEGFEYTGYKVRGRYRFGDIGEYAVDPLIYVEVIHEPGEKVLEFEQKLVLAKNIGNWALTFNLTTEEEHQFNANREAFAVNPSIGVGYQFAPWITLGTEFIQENEFEEGEDSVHTFFAGPTISLATSRFYLNLGAALQATRAYDHAPRYKVRSLIGLFF